MSNLIALVNEIKSLKKEIASLREQNISFANQLSQQHQLINNSIHFFNGQYLNNYLVQLAGMQTADFILKEMNKVKAFSDKKNYLKYVLSHVKNVSGEILEFGVYKGETINIISETLPDKIIYGFDSFEGLPETWRSGFEKTAFDMKNNLPQVNKNVRLIKGWFNETLPKFVEEHPESCAFIHVDCDLYSSTKTIFSELRKHIIPGTVIAFDEYFNYPSWQEGEYKAFMEFLEENHLRFEYIARTEHEQAAVIIM